MKKKSVWSVVSGDFSDDEFCYVDGWLTNDQNEEGVILAKIKKTNGKIHYFDARAKTDENAQSIILDCVNQIESAIERQETFLNCFLKDVSEGKYDSLRKLIMNTENLSLLRCFPDNSWGKLLLEIT